MAFEIKKAVRTKQPVLISLWGGSSSGKTYSALRIARGLVGPQGKIGLIDTENRRALHYAGTAGGEWDHLDFEPPYTPERYIEAFKAFENAGGYDCVIVDSGSHVWEGEGGVLDQADKVDPKKGLYRWASPKTSYKKMINALLRAPFHVIFCLRSKMGVAQVVVNGKKEIASTGLVPIAEKNTIYEMTVSVALGNDQFPMFQDLNNKFWIDPNIPRIKAPAAILQAIKPGQHLDELTGVAIRQWADGGTRDIIDEARRVARRGMDSYKAWWTAQSAEDKRRLQASQDELKAIAIQADEEQARLDAGEEAPQEEEPIHDDPFRDGPEEYQENNPPVPPLEDYSRRLASADWTYMMADDPRVMKVGEANIARLEAEAKQNGQKWVQAFNAARKKAWPLSDNNTADHTENPF